LKKINKEEMIRVRVTKEEKKKIEEYAQKLGFTTSKYIRNIVLMELDSFLVKSGADEKLIKAIIYIKEKLAEPNIKERLSTEE
jgi:hypothetical protein